MHAHCLACEAKMTIKAYCAENPAAMHCDTMCCVMQTASCLACQQKTTIKEFC